MNRATRAAGAAFVGTTIEWYDFYVYATAAALLFDDLFFPNASSPTVALMASFATYAVGFFARPLGGIVFGHFGDRVGRKSALVVTLLMMGGATFLVGLLPTYDSIGALAPVLLVLLRFVQGLAVGGEWGGAALMAVEHAPAGRKTFYGGFAQLGNPAGALLATGAFSLMSLSGEQAMQAWGWRVPFIVSAVLVLVGLFIRLRVEESPVFEAADRTGVPIKEVFRTSWRSVLLGVGTLPVAIGGYYLLTTFLLSYATGPSVGASEQLILNGLSFASFVELVATLGIAWLGDRFGARKVAVWFLVLTALLAVPQFAVLGSGNAVLIFALLGLMRLATSGTYGPMAAILAEMFPPQVRYTGISLAYQGAGAIFGGLSPLAATALVGAYGGAAWPAVALLVGMCVLSVICLAVAPRHRDREPVPSTVAE
ncbi:L-Proline/Glycine betaine transporter ProP [[Actinomadura] parvosata subsp. kistnae]|uniref:Putative proline/betaine transporter n=1 Tax=[Actinomadura] parvosata subsp. kistnae TaxID=1909395 RepID=A0A1U9ZXY3_9ACTN|nr:MFS transporter [Nonomuraea sp. ATCC 55076]AQZ62821.1 LysR family transcriptional regulator [Nonomuraea sp. ATCC 55076]SPL98354.1 L-Proline/Glycine betaine transporter ProP [Actinomadura parvosata subsp. kistnae]